MLHLSSWALALCWLVKANLAAFSSSLTNLTIRKFLQCGLYEFPLYAPSRHQKLIDLQIMKNDLTLQKEHFSFKAKPLARALLDQFFQVIFCHGFKISFETASLSCGLDLLFCHSLMLFGKLSF
jgi:hypothetical protein